MTFPYIRAGIARSLGSAGAGVAKARAYSLQQRATPRMSAACDRGEHSSCFSLKCTCTKCGHNREVRRG